MIKGMNHVGISVANLDRSIQFYKQLLGLDVAIRTRFEGDQYERLLALPNCQGEVALLRSQHIQIELFEFINPNPKCKDPDKPVCDHGITHICVEVAEIESEYDRLTALGVAFHCPPVNFSGIAKAAYGRDPDGNVFELLELLTAAPSDSTP